MNSTSPIYIGVIGCGRCSPNHIRNFSTLEGSTGLACADPDAERLKAVSRLYPDVATVTNYLKPLANPRINAVVIATPTATH